MILSYLPNCKLGAFQVIYRKKLWSLSLKRGEIIPVLPTLGKFYVQSPRQAEMTKHWEIFRDFISLPDNDKVDFGLSEGTSYLIYHQLPRCHQPHFTFFKPPQLGDADSPLLWGWSTAKRLTNHGTLLLSATCFFIVMKRECSKRQTVIILLAKEGWFTPPHFSGHQWGGQATESSLFSPSCWLFRFVFSKQRNNLLPAVAASEERLSQIFKEAQESIGKVTLTGLTQITHQFLFWSWIPSRPTMSWGKVLGNGLCI